MFHKIKLDLETNPFKELSENIYYEDVAKGRKGTVLVDDKDGFVPIIRTTTQYSKPAQSFRQIHYNIIHEIKTVASQKGIGNVEFNNALIEVYDSSYQTMGYHSDQALDMAEDSFIGIFSCYDDPKDIRSLMIKEKNGSNKYNLKMDHMSVILFSTKTNSEHLHKIVLEKNTANNHWLGITFRLSKTKVKFIDQIPYLPNNERLTLATDEEKNEFFKNRGQENKLIGFTYPETNYTISPSDLIPIPKE